MPAKAGTAEPASTKAATIKRSIDLILFMAAPAGPSGWRSLRLLLAADETLGEICPTHAQAEQGHGRRFGNLNGNACQSGRRRTRQNQNCNNQTIHGISPIKY